MQRVMLLVVMGLTPYLAPLHLLVAVEAVLEPGLSMVEMVVLAVALVIKEVPVLVILHPLHLAKEITAEPEILLLVETHKAVVAAVQMP